MKTFIPSILATCALCFGLTLTGCNQGEPDNVVTTPPPSSEDVSDHGHDHDHKHGPNGYPVVDLNDGTEIEWDFDSASGTFLLIPPAEMAESVKQIAVETTVDGTDSQYVFKPGEESGSWTLENMELGTAMMMGDAVKRTLVITLNDGNSMTAPVAHFEGH
ncbi:MAG: hypothetical protein P8L85_06940 [Rubripirellula sp.]|nr:hypothetical protein [Rubripirellula sp.]